MRNIVTEEEAATKRCPQLMGRSDLVNRYCKGSDCMAWRWHSEETLEKGYGEKTVVLKYGYCGKVPLT